MLHRLHYTFLGVSEHEHPLRVNFLPVLVAAVIVLLFKSTREQSNDGNLVQHDLVFTMF